MGDTLGTLKTAYDLAKDLVNLHDATVRQGKVAELQRQILDAQQSAIDANQERATLMETISQHREPAHYARTDCYSDNRISILKPETWDPGRCKVLSWHRCGSALYLAGAMWPEHQKYRSPRR